MVHDLNPGRYFVEEQTGPNATYFAQISSGFLSSNKGAWSYFKVPIEVRGDLYAPGRTTNLIRPTNGVQ